MTIDNLLNKQGVQFNVIRNNNVITSAVGLYNQEKSTSKKYVEFKPLTDIQTNDCLINTVNEKIYITDVKTFYLNGKPFSLMAFYHSEAEHNAVLPSQGIVFNINNANNSVIGNNNTLNINYNNQLQELKNSIENSNEPDKKELSEIISLLELVVNDKVPVKKGLLSKFGDILAKHSWLASQITALLLSWMTSQ